MNLRIDGRLDNDAEVSIRCDGDFPRKNLRVGWGIWIISKFYYSVAIVTITRPQFCVVAPECSCAVGRGLGLAQLSQFCEDKYTYSSVQRWRFARRLSGRPLETR